MTGRILKSSVKDDVVQIFPNISYGKIIFDSLSKSPDTICMIDALTEKQITNKNLLHQSIKAAIALKKLSIERNDVIGIVSENSLSYSIPILASLYIGTITHPVNPAYTTRELKNVFDISKPKIVFVSEQHIKSILTLKEEVDYIEHIIVFGAAVDGVIELEELLKSGNDDVDKFVPCKINTEEDVAVLLCSSGTTGLPKVVMLTHANLSTSSTAIVHGIGCKESDTTVGLMPFYHAFGFILILSAMLTGMKIILLSRFIPDIFLRIIQDYKITKLLIAPPLAVFMAKSPLVHNYNLTSITDLICAGASLGSEVQHLVEKRFNVIVRQGYGMTEIGCMTALPLGSLSKVGSAGKLLYGAIAKITDLKTNITLEANEVGEICTKSKMVMKGYMGNEIATQEMFDDEGFLHTGDIGYFDENGFLFIVDRLKELIKYKGFQVAPAELEDLLTSHKDIADAGVIGIPDERAGEVPIAFVVRKPGAVLTEEEIISYIADAVSIQKQLYGGVRFIHAIPKSATGKILRKDLRKLMN